MTDSATTALDADISPVTTERAVPAWAPVFSLMLGAFSQVTAEFLPASLLTPIATDLGVSVGAAGQVVTATSLVGIVAGVAMTIVTRAMDRRLVLWMLTALLIVSNVLSATAGSLPVLLFARVLLGISLSGFWAMATATAMRLVPAEALPRAISLIFSGVSIATVSAAPIGAYLGDLWGWRNVFMLAAVVSGVVLVFQMLTLPRLPPLTSPDVRTLFVLLRRPSVRLVMIAVGLSISGHFAGFTYIRHFLEQVPLLPVTAISLVLLAFGVGGFIGNFVGGALVARSVKGAIVMASAAIAVLALVLFVAGSSGVVAGIAVGLWGFAFGALPVGFQTWMVRVASDEAESAGGLLVSAFQIAITLGAVIGGILVDGFGPFGAVGYLAAATLAGALLVSLSRDGAVKA
ncbi:MFS transporter [Rhodopseudomonas boonkerdii]|uniref:MFS transporter n=1 Tax=Rhodopseudomonas boonkerdii TaxID=475937 RepID=UPI001E4313CE|nr:MFS transporter [Rhodopseudomonas boonkerdii]UGV28365.1 MFS transporter [Rhodopseudomonas boonkerdii]